MLTHYWFSLMNMKIDKKKNNNKLPNKKSITNIVWSGRNKKKEGIKKISVAENIWKQKRNKKVTIPNLAWVVSIFTISMMIYSMDS